MSLDPRASTRLAPPVGGQGDLGRLRLVDEKPGDRDVQRPRERRETGQRRRRLVVLDLGQIADVEPGGIGDAGQGHPALGPPAMHLATDRRRPPTDGFDRRPGVHEFALHNMMLTEASDGPMVVASTNIA